MIAAAPRGRPGALGPTPPPPLAAERTQETAVAGRAPHDMMVAGGRRRRCGVGGIEGGRRPRRRGGEGEGAPDGELPAARAAASRARRAIQMAYAHLAASRESCRARHSAENLERPRACRIATVPAATTPEWPMAIGGDAASPSRVSVGGPQGAKFGFPGLIQQVAGRRRRGGGSSPLPPAAHQPSGRATYPPECIYLPSERTPLKGKRHQRTW